MARIEEKSKAKLSSVIGTWIIAGILSAVVITAIVLVIIYYVEINKKDEEKVFEERFPDAQHITYEENRVYQLNCTECHHAIFHQDYSWDSAVRFFEKLLIVEEARH